MNTSNGDIKLTHKVFNNNNLNQISNTKGYKHITHKEFNNNNLNNKELKQRINKTKKNHTVI